MKSTAEVNAAMAKRTEELYKEAFSKGVSLRYQDERSPEDGQFVQANPDGSEQLVELIPGTRTFKVLKELCPPGRGYWAYLSPLIQHGGAA